MTSTMIDRIDGLSSAAAIKGPCKVATTANITLYGEQTIDGVAVVEGDRVLVKDQTAGYENGIYVCDTGQWRRSKDFNRTNDVVKGTMVFVNSGTVSAETMWAVTSDNPVVVGTDAIAFSNDVLVPPDDSVGPDALKAPEIIRDYLDTAPYVADRTALKALDTAQDTVAFLKEAGREGMFKWTAGDFSSQVTSDTQEGIYIKADDVAATSGAWVRDVKAKVIYAEHFGVTPGTDVTTAAKALYDGLSDAVVIWSPGTYDLTDYILVNGDNVTSMCPAGRDAINIRQKTWGLPCFSTADPNDTSVRPNGVRFFDMGGEAWNDGVKCYFYDAFYGPGSSGPYTCSADVTSTSANVILARNGVLEAPASVSGAGTGTLTITLSSPQTSTDYINIKVTNKADLQGQADLWNQQKAAESTFIFHGGGDDFIAERIWAEGFVCPLTIVGDWTSNSDGQQSKRLRLHDIKSNWCDFILISEIEKAFIDEIHAGKIAETQTDNGIFMGLNGSGVPTTFKDPHAVYGTDNSTSAYSSDFYIGRYTGDNRYSSIYKFRNLRGLRLDAGAIRSFLRVIDIENCQNGELYFPHISGAVNDYYDLQRSALNVYGCTGLKFRVGQMYVTSDTAFPLRFLKGFDGVSTQHMVEIDQLFLTGTSSRTQPWIISHGAVDCFVSVKDLYILGDLPTYVYRAREENISSPSLGASRGGFSVDRVIATATSPNLKIAQLSSSGGAAQPANMRISAGKRMSVGGTWDSSTFSDAGSGNRILIDGVEFPAGTITATFATPGDAVLSPTNIETSIVRIGDFVKFSASFTLAANSFTTASGALQITLSNLPAASTALTNWPINVADIRGLDLGASTRSVGGYLNSSGMYFTLRQSGDDDAGSTIGSSAITPGETGIVIALDGAYRAA